jgi:hypothetical protein
LADAEGAGWIGLTERDEGVAETGGILLRDREDTDAALGTSGAAREVRATTLCGAGKCGVNDLYEISDGRPRKG